MNTDATASTGFLKFNTGPPKLYITGDEEDPDPTLYQHFKDEGFHTSYIPCRGERKAYRERLKKLSSGLQLGESYAIVAYGNAAAECLDCHIKPQAHLAALIAYYPPVIEKPETKYPPDLNVMCQLAGNQNITPAFPFYKYPGTKPGFAEHDMDEFSKASASLAWTRTLAVLRKGLKIEANLEKVRNEQVAAQFTLKDPARTVGTMDQEEAYVNHVPTLTGAKGRKDLFLFYRDHFVKASPPSLSIKLVSRTIGVDRVVDEMIISFKHTQQVPWMLPSVPPTDKLVHVALVSIVAIRGGKLCNEHLYWDQASVLVQIGLLDPKVVPPHLRKKGLQRLPVYGSEAASKVLDEDSQPFNDLIASWKDRPKGDPGASNSR